MHYLDLFIFIITSRFLAVFLLLWCRIPLLPPLPLLFAFHRPAGPAASRCVLHPEPALASRCPRPELCFSGVVYGLSALKSLCELVKGLDFCV